MSKCHLEKWIVFQEEEAEVEAEAEALHQEGKAEDEENGKVLNGGKRPRNLGIRML